MKSYIKQIKEEYALDKNIYFNKLSSGAMTKEAFIQSQIPFYHAVIYFSRPMLALASRLDSYEQRWPIIENCIEEHGEGNFKMTHGASFLQFLATFNVKNETVQHQKLAQGVAIFNNTLMNNCLNKDWRIGVATLGIIEDMFSDISSCISKTIIKNKWLQPHEIVHYNCHEELDIKHSDDFYELIEEDWESHYALIAEGLKEGASSFLELYTALYRLE